MDKSDVLILGRMIPNELDDDVLTNSKSVAPNSASPHLKKIINGIDAVIEGKERIINVLPVSSYPRYYKKLFVRELKFSHNNISEDISIGYCNLMFLKRFSIQHSLNKHVRIWAKKDNGMRKKVIVYTPNIHFLSACKIIKRIVPNCHVCVIVPDLPIYTDLDKNKLYSVITNHKAKNVNKLLEVADSFVFLTEAMADYFPVKRPYIISEGIVDEKIESNILYKPQKVKNIVYTGSFTRKFGVMDLVDSFKYIDDENINLVLCGGGECTNEILDASKSDPRIIYKGLVNHAESIKIQKEAYILVNPRNDNEDFTKYSFPSKIMEYMATGRPVLCFKLRGIPDEYDKYIKYFRDEKPQHIAEDITAMCGMGEDKLSEIGNNAREFVINHKNSNIFAKKMFSMIEKRNILFVNNSFNIGGTTTSLLNLLHTIDKSKYNIDLLLMRNEGELLDSIPKNINLLEPALNEKVPILSKIYKLFIYTIRGYTFKAFIYNHFHASKYKHGLFQLMSGDARSRAARKINKHYDTAIGYMEGFANFYVANKVCADKKIAYIHANYKGASLDPKLDIKMIGSMNKVVVVTESARFDFCDVFPKYADKCSVVSNIVSKSFINKKAMEDIDAYNISNEYFNIITVARIDNVSKALYRCIYACAKLIENGYKVKWYVFGDGKDMQYLLDMINTYKLENTFFLMGGRVNIYPYIKNSDLFVLSSKYEGKPMAVTEAQYLEVPVLVTEYESAREQIESGKTGFIVNNDDQDSLYEGIKNILDNRESLEDIKKNLKELSDDTDLSMIYDLIS